MLLSLRIALRYLVARKSHNAVNVIAAIAVGGVAVAVAAMVAVLSIYNGFDELARKRLSRLDAELQVTRADGRMIEYADSVVDAVETVAGVCDAMPVIEERALMVMGNAQMPVIIKGVPRGYSELIAPLDSLIIDGHYDTQSTTGMDAGQVSVGVANNMLIIPAAVPVVDLYMPRRYGRINPANPMAAFTQAQVMVSGVFQVDQGDIDSDHVIVPLNTARILMDTDEGATAVELSVDKGHSVDKVRDELRRKLGPEWLVKNRKEQRSEVFRMVSVEKWVTFMMLIFVLAIAMFNIVSTLSLLIIEKRDNMQTLRALGSTRRQVGSVFAWQGFLTTVAGGVLGIVIGVALALMQQYLHIIKLGGNGTNTVIDYYPVRVDFMDILAVMAAVVVTGALMAGLARVLARRTLN